MHLETGTANMSGLVSGIPSAGKSLYHFLALSSKFISYSVCKREIITQRLFDSDCIYGYSGYLETGTASV